MGANSENLRSCWNEASLCIITTTTSQICRIGNLLTVGPTLHYLSRADVGDEENRNRQLIAMVVNIEMNAKLSEIDTVEELSTSHDESTMTGAEAKWATCKQRVQAMCKQQFGEH